MSRISRFAQNLRFHFSRVRPACGCDAFTVCLACPRWKLEAQSRYHEDGAAGMRELPDHAPGWRYYYHRESWEIRRRWVEHPGGFAGHVNDLFREIKRYERWQPRLLWAAGALAGLGLGAGSAVMLCAAALLCAWAFRQEILDPPRRAARLAARSWQRAGEPEASHDRPTDLRPTYD